jgi:SAM-dependent methyltransferase
MDIIDSSTNEYVKQYIVLGNVMCEVPDQMSFLRDLDRVLKPGGKIIFQEHIRERDGTLTGQC